MNVSGIASAVLTAVTTILALTGAINTEESGTLLSTGTAAATGVTSFALAVAAVVKARRARKGE